MPDQIGTNALFTVPQYKGFNTLQLTPSIDPYKGTLTSIQYYQQKLGPADQKALESKKFPDYSNQGVPNESNFLQFLFGNPTVIEKEQKGDPYLP
jgi:hypothetical protein